MVERRNYLRYKFPLCVRYKDSNLTKEFSGVIRDISIGGVRVSLDTPLVISPNSLASLFILFPKRILKIAGRIVWSRNAGDREELGVCFTEVTDTCKEIIYDHIFKYLEEEFTRNRRHQ